MIWYINIIFEISRVSILYGILKIWIFKEPWILLKKARVFDDRRIYTILIRYLIYLGTVSELVQMYTI